MAIKVALQCPWQHTLFYAEPGKPLQLIKTQPRHHSTNASNVLALSPRPPSPLTVSPSESQRVLDLLDKAISKAERKQYAHVKSRLPLLISAAEIPAEEETQHLNWASLNAFVVTENKPNILCSSANGRHLVASFLVRCFTQGIHWCDLHKQYYCQKWGLTPSWSHRKSSLTWLPCREPRGSKSLSQQQPVSWYSSLWPWDGEDKEQGGQQNFGTRRIMKEKRVSGAGNTLQENCRNYRGVGNVVSGL